MKLPMTAEQIETTLAQAHADVAAVALVTREERVLDRALSKALRACFVVGSDHGQSVILERAESLVTGSVVDAQTLQLARSTEALVAWVSAEDPLTEIRSYTVRRTAFVDPGKLWAATAHALERSQLCYGASHAEALSKLATWCNEQGKRDTTPAPALEVAQ